MLGFGPLGAYLVKCVHKSSNPVSVTYYDVMLDYIWLHGYLIASKYRTTAYCDVIETGCVTSEKWKN